MDFSCKIRIACYTTSKANMEIKSNIINIILLLWLNVCSFCCARSTCENSRFNSRPTAPKTQKIIKYQIIAMEMNLTVQKLLNAFKMNVVYMDCNRMAWFSRHCCWGLCFSHADCLFIQLEIALQCFGLMCEKWVWQIVDYYLWACDLPIAARLMAKKMAVRHV